MAPDRTLSLDKSGEKLARVKVDLMYFDGCPSYMTTLKDLQDIIAQHGLHAEISMVKVESEAEAKKLGFLGSPTVRINGVDAEPSARKSEDYAFACRVYRVGGRIQGLPPKELLMKALGVTSSNGA